MRYHTCKISENRWQVHAMQFVIQVFGRLAAVSCMVFITHQITAEEQSMPSIDSQTVMFYYDDLEEASEFYEQTIGLEKTVDFDWVKFYRISDTSHVGIVRAGAGAYH